MDSASVKAQTPMALCKEPYNENDFAVPQDGRWEKETLKPETVTLNTDTEHWNFHTLNCPGTVGGRRNFQDLHSKHVMKYHILNMRHSY